MLKKTYNTLHSCHNFPAGSRQAARGARICETSLFSRNIVMVINLCNNTLLEIWATTE